jgi:hypothetical protein
MHFLRCFLNVATIKNYIAAVSTKGENYSAESLFIYLILQQQKIINELIARVSEYKKLQKQTQ